MTRSNPEDSTPPYEIRHIDQFPTIGPSLDVQWFTDGSVVISVGEGLTGPWVLTNFSAGSDAVEGCAILRLEPSGNR